MKKRFSFCVLVLLSIFSLYFASCASTSGLEGDSTSQEESSDKKTAKKKRVSRIKFDDEAYNQAAKNADFDTAYGMIESLGSKANLAKQLDKSLILFRTGFYQEADKNFVETTKGLDEAFTKSIVQGAATAVLNENLTEYSGSLYEFLLVDTFAALNAYKMGNLELSYSLLTRVYDKQKKYVSDYGELILHEDEKSKSDDYEEQKKSEAALAVIGVNFHAPYDIPKKLSAEQKDALIYKTSPLADYLQIVIGAQNGSYVDDFTVRELKSLVPQIETDSADLPSAKGRIEVLSLTGTVAQRKQHTDWLVFDLLNFGETISGVCGYENALKFKFVWPEYEPQNNHVKVTRVSVQGEGASLSKSAVLLEDFDKAVQNDIDLKASKAAWRSVWRSTGKKAVGLAGIIAAIQADQSDGLFSMMAIIAGAQGLRALDKSETADIRQAQALPSKAYAAGFTLDPGTYTVTIEYSNGKKEVVENVKVLAKRPVLVESICAK